MGIYDSAETYAKEIHIKDLHLAGIRANHYRNLMEQQYEARKCPKCGKHSLQFEGGSYEENTRDYIYCENGEVLEKDLDDGTLRETDCGYATEFEDKHRILTDAETFDEVLMFSIEIEEHGKEYVESMVGKKWEVFVKEGTEELLKEGGN